MGVFRLKYRDTRPILEVVLHDPAPDGSPPNTHGPTHDLTGTTSWKLHIKLSEGVYLARVMTIEGPATNGTLRYVWLDTDWDVGSSGSGTLASPYTVGGLTVSPDLPLARGIQEHQMEYEVISPSGRLTFPNAGYDILRILSDFGQG